MHEDQTVATSTGIGMPHRVPWAVKIPVTTLTVALLLVLAAGAGAVGAAPMTDLERQRLVAHLEMTGSWLVDEVSGLSPAQLRFRRAPGTWSILEVIDHLLVAEPIYWQDLQKALKAPPRSQNRIGGDADTLWYGIDRRTADGHRGGRSEGTTAGSPVRAWTASARYVPRC